MEGARIGALVARTVQLVSAAVVLGLSITLYQNFDLLKDLCRTAESRRDRAYCNNAIGRWPSSLLFAAFTGAFGLLDFFVGMVAVFLTGLPTIAVLVVDALAAVFYLAGGINLAVLYPGWKAERCGAEGGSRYCPSGTRITTDIAFHFIGLVAIVVALALVFLSRRSRV